MVYFNRINTSEATDVNKKYASNKCDIFYYWYFLNNGFMFQPNVYNRCHDLLMMSMNLSNLLNIKSADYCCVISGISKNDAIDVMQIPI